MNFDAFQTFHRLHRHGLLLLANAWDAGSARLIESLGADAMATTSAGMAWAQGYPDGDALPATRLHEMVSAITRVIRVPLSVDIEGGYSDDPLAVGDTAAALIDAGVAGINIEDGTGGPALLCAKIERIKHVAFQRGGDLFVNVRTDVYLRGLVPAERRVGETLVRAARYRIAGADGLFVPGLTAVDEIREVVAGSGLPLNLLARPGLPPARELEALGVRRLSAGSNLAESAYARIASLTQAFLRDGASDPLCDDAMPYADLNALFVVD